MLILLFAANASASTVYDRIRILVNDRVITQNEINIRLIEFLRQRGQSALSDQKKTELRSEMANQLIEEALLDIRADALKIVLTEEQLDAEVDHFRKKNNLSQLEFEELLERRNLSLTDYKSSFRKRTRRSMVINQEIHSQINIPNETLKTLYEKGEGKTAKVRARHILLLLKKGASAEEIEQVRQKVNWIKKQIQSGKSFREMADLHSQDPSVKSNHGDLGFFGKGDMVREFAEVAFAIEPGTLSEPVRSPFGFHLIEVVEKREEPQQTFDSVKQKLYQQAYKEAFDKLYKSYMANLKQKARIIKR